MRSFQKQVLGYVTIAFFQVAYANNVLSTDVDLAEPIASKIDKSVFEKTLENGLKVIVKEDHRMPIVVSQIWYKVGASYESNGQTGVSHVLEHLMFKGTEKHPNDSFNKIISRHGGEDNAFTSRDYTAYYQKLEASRLGISFKLEADRMRNLTISDEDFNKEVLVVQEERRWRTDDKPQARAYEQLYVTAFENTGYHHPIIGWMDDLQNLTKSDVKQWYQRFYKPSNSTLVVVGNVKAKDVFQLADKYFAPIQAEKIRPIKKLAERKQWGIKQVTMKLPAKIPYLIMGFKAPTILTAEVDWEPYALDLLSGILDGGDSTRLPYQLVKQQQVAASVGTSYSSNARLKTLFVIDVTPSKDKSLDDVNKAIFDELEKVKTSLVSKDELSRIKNQIIASSVFEKDSMFSQAMKIGGAETTGVGWEVEAKYVDKIRQITAEQIREVAKKYLILDQLTKIRVIPSEKTVSTLSSKSTTKNISKKSLSQRNQTAKGQATKGIGG